MCQIESMSAKDDLLDPKNREDALILAAAVALHGLLAGGVPVGATFQHVVENAFSLGREFLKAAEAVKP
jgi:hypothetical protein